MTECVYTYILRAFVSLYVCLCIIVSLSLSLSLYVCRCADEVTVFFDNQYTNYNHVVSKLRGKSNSSHIRIFGTGITLTSVPLICIYSFPMKFLHLVRTKHRICLSPKRTHRQICYRKTEKYCVVSYADIDTSLLEQAGLLPCDNLTCQGQLTAGQGHKVSRACDVTGSVCVCSRGYVLQGNLCVGSLSVFSLYKTTRTVN